VPFQFIHSVQTYAITAECLESNPWLRQYGAVKITVVNSRHMVIDKANYTVRIALEAWIDPNVRASS
jgi:hypothetical protein